MIDYILDENGDYLIRDGQFVIGDSDKQNIFDILYSEKGEYKAHPEIGAGVGKLSHSPYEKETIKSLIKSNLVLDNFSVSDVKITTKDNVLIIDPIAIR